MTKKQRARRKARRQQSTKHAQTAARHDRENAIKRRLRTRERVILPAGREWLAVEAYPLSGARCATALKAVGLPVFEAREKVREERNGRPPRVAMVPVMRRVLFVGLRGWSDMRQIEECRHVRRVFSVTVGGLDWVPREHYRQALFEAEILGYRTMPFISGAAMQEFADHVIGYKQYDARTGLSHIMTEMDLLALLFKPGDRVKVTGGPFASFPCVVESHNSKTDLYTVGVSVLGRIVRIPCEEGQLVAC
jgi:transcription antitermination factor NusG